MSEVTERARACIKWTIDKEGGFVNHPQDKGGATKFGISSKAYPKEDISALTMDRAVEIYFTDYWLKAECDKLPPPVDMVTFDAAVHHGVSRSLRWTSVLTEILLREHPLECAQRMLKERISFMFDIVVRSPSQSIFWNGWTNRVMALARHINNNK